MPRNDTNHRRIFTLPEEHIHATNAQRPARPRRHSYPETASIANGTDSRERPTTGCINRPGSLFSASASLHSSSTTYSTTTASQMGSLDCPMSDARPPQHPYALYLQGVPGAETQSDILLYPPPVNAQSNIHALDGYWEPLPAYSSGTQISHLPPIPVPIPGSLSARFADGEAPASTFTAGRVDNINQENVSRAKLCGLPIWVAILILLLSIIAMVLSAALAAAMTGRHVQQQQAQQPTTAYTTVTAQQSISLPTLTLPPPVPSVD